MSSGMGGIDAPTPAVAAYKAQKEVTEKSMRLLWRRIAAALGIGLIISIGGNIFSAVTVNEIRSTQITNTSINRCEVASFNAVLKDVRLAFSGDSNAADYAKAPKSC